MRALAAGLGAVLLVGCGQGFDRAAAIESFSAANPAATEAGADCVIDRLIARYGLDGLERELEAEPPAPAFEEAQFRAMFGCGVDVGIREQILVELQANDVAEADAPCVADELLTDLSEADLDVLLSGELTDEFLARFISAMEACGVVNS